MMLVMRKICLFILLAMEQSVIGMVNVAKIKRWRVGELDNIG
jgi:hypothetical protein